MGREGDISKIQAVILGASGHGKVVMSTLHCAGYKVVAFLDDKESLAGSEFANLPVKGPLKEIRNMRNCAAVIAIGDNSARSRVAQIYSHVHWLTPVHPFSFVDGDTMIGEGSVVFAGAVIQSGTHVGRHCIVNTSATIDHDCRVEDFTHVSPGVHLAGGVLLGHGCWIGIGSRIVQGVRVGRNSVVGAGSTVTNDIPDNVLVYGTPAKVRKKFLAVP